MCQRYYLKVVLMWNYIRLYVSKWRNDVAKRETKCQCIFLINEIFQNDNIKSTENFVKHQ